MMYLVTDNTDPASPSLTRLTPASVANREFASFPQALGPQPASRDVSATVARLRARKIAVTTGPVPASSPIVPLRWRHESTRRIERAAGGLAAVMLAVIALKVGGAL